MKHLLVIHTGGTISMSQDQSNKVVTNDINLFHCIKMS
ncbi:L-asparaginase [Staphylococcus aureus]|uniref:asparaginase n=1 Tax=Staphylococcus aureus TaxID=1280 RepID=A0A2X2KCS7_STAAU|nr:L-asparaginase [Staphylococcus aureus]